MGVGVFPCLQHMPGIRQWDPSAEDWGPDLCLTMGPESEAGVPLSGDSYPEMGGVWLGRVLINAQITAPLFMGHSHRLSKK